MSSLYDVDDSEPPEWDDDDLDAAHDAAMEESLMCETTKQHLRLIHKDLRDLRERVQARTFDLRAFELALELDNLAGSLERLVTTLLEHE